MKFKVIIDENRDEELLLFLHSHSELEEKIKSLLNDNKTEIIGYRRREIVKLSPSDITCFFVESGRTYAKTENERFRVNLCIYELEEALGDGFVKINQSCIANISKIDRFDASLAGSLLVIFKDGTKDYVSRRQIKKVKERIGFKL